MLNKQEDIFHRGNIANVISAWHKWMQSGLLIFVECANMAGNFF
jgi:hypothetical protein